MKDINRIKGVLVEKKRTTKWLPFVGGGAMLSYMLQQYPNIKHLYKKEYTTTDLW